MTFQNLYSDFIGNLFFFYVNLLIWEIKVWISIQFIFMHHHFRLALIIGGFDLLFSVNKERLILFFYDANYWTFHVLTLSCGIWWKKTHKLKFICLIEEQLGFQKFFFSKLTKNIWLNWIRQLFGQKNQCFFLKDWFSFWLCNKW